MIRIITAALVLSTSSLVMASSHNNDEGIMGGKSSANLSLQEPHSPTGKTGAAFPADGEPETSDLRPLGQPTPPTDKEPAATDKNPLTLPSSTTIGTHDKKKPEAGGMNPADSINHGSDSEYDEWSPGLF